MTSNKKDAEERRNPATPSSLIPQRQTLACGTLRRRSVKSVVVPERESSIELLQDVWEEHAV